MGRRGPYLVAIIILVPSAWPRAHAQEQVPAPEPLKASAATVGSFTRGPEWSDESYLRGRALRERGDLAEAEASFRRALERFPSSASVANDLAAVLIAVGSHAEALSVLEKTVQTAPGYGPAAVNLAILYTRTQRPEKAREVLWRAHTKAPDDARVALDLALAEVSGGHAERAVEILRSIPAVSPYRADAAYDLGIALLRAGDAKSAAAALAEAAELSPRQADAPYALGLAYSKLGEVSRAVSAFEESRRRGSDHAVACARQLGRIKEQRGALEEAVVELRRALVDARRAPSWHARAKAAIDEAVWAASDLGRVLYRLGRSAEAAEAYKTAVELRPSDPGLRFDYGLSLALSGNIVEAREQARTLRTADAELAGKLDALVVSAEARNGRKVVPWEGR